MVCGCVFFFLNTSAQKTAIYYDVNQKYIKGLELFDVKDYVNARKQFQEVLDMTRFVVNPEIETFTINAEYYRAISALELLNPDGEMLMLAFLENNVANSKTNMAYFYLGKYYYTKRNFSEAIDYLERVDQYELSAEQREDYRFQLAYAYFFKKEFNKAKNLFSQVKTSKTYYYPAHYYHGFISFMEGDYETALADFNKVTESNYFGQVVPYYITSIYFQQKKYDQAIEYAKPLMDDKRLKYYAEINQLIGKAYFEKGEFAKALPYLSYYAETNSRMTKEDLFQLGYAQYKVKDYKKAVDNFQQLVRSKDSIAQNALYLMGDSYIQLGDKTRARTAFMEASSMEFDPFVRENALFNYGKVSYELGFSNTSVSTLKEFLSTYPNSKYDTEAKELLTDILLSTRNYKEALETIEGIKNKTPKVKEAYQKVAFFRGVEFFNSNNYTEAEKMFNKALDHPIDGDLHAQSWYWKGEIDMAQNDFEGAITNYNKFLNFAGSSRRFPPQSSPATANYGLGYAYYKTEKFGSALTYFDRASQQLDAMPSNAKSLVVKQKLMPDVLLRKADAQFMTKDYANSLVNYERVIRENYPGTDYALFQKGMLHGLISQPTQKIESMQNLISKYPNSMYYDDAMYERANTLFLDKKTAQAAEGFERLIKEQQNSRFVVQALLKLALIAYNNNQDQKAIQYYKRVAQDYPGTPEASQALAQIKDISIKLGDPDIYIETSGASLSEQDTVIFRSAENFYYENDCAKAANEFSKYLSRFPDGYFALTAHYMRGDCYYKQKEYDKAMIDYEYVIQNSRNAQQTEIAYLRAAKIAHLINNNMDKAFDYYQQALQLSSFKGNTIDALRGLLETSYKLNRFDATERYAKQVLQMPQVPDDLIWDAHYYQGKLALANNNLESAMASFTQTVKMTGTEKGVEAEYYTAEINFKRNNPKEAEKIAENLIKTSPSFEYWVVKSFILLSDIYVQRNELHQARATLQSIVDNYRGAQELQTEAKNKLAKVNAALEGKSRVREGNDEFFEPEAPNNK